MNLLKRFLTALVLGPIIVFLLWGFNPYGLFGIAFLALAIALWEYGQIVFPSQTRERMLIFFLGLLTLVFLFGKTLSEKDVSWLPAFPSTEIFFVGIFLFLSWITLFFPREIPSAPSQLSLMFLGIFYCGVLLSFVAMLSTLGAGPAWVTMLLTISWLGDTGGYFAGRFLGGKIFSQKLYPKISPKKTWEGFFGGLLGSFLATVIAKFWYFPFGYTYAGFSQISGPNLSWLDCILIAIPAGAIGISGDLFESLLKRAFGVKDSGAILPGHGGMLDRVDAVIFAAPYVYCYGRYFFALPS